MKGAVEPYPDVESSSDAYARRFAGAAGALFLARQEEAVLKALGDKRNVSILDVGGGHAQLSGPLSAAGHAVTVLGSDPACAARLRLDARNAAVRFVEGDLLALPFEDRSFDTVVSIRLMAHIPDWKRFVAELCRVARISVVVDYPELISLNALSMVTFGIKRMIERDTRPYRSFTEATLRREFARHGFGARSNHRQFLLPMALHRAAKGAAPLAGLERLAWKSGLSSRLGNPGLLRLDRSGG